MHFIDEIIDFINKNFSKEENIFFVIDGLETVMGNNISSIYRDSF